MWEEEGAADPVKRQEAEVLPANILEAEEEDKEIQGDPESIQIVFTFYFYYVFMF